ncbi:MAG: hypothetical protein WCK39_02525 [Methanomassiliicoccales archaeon]
MQMKNANCCNDKARAIVIRCDDPTYTEALERLKSMGCTILYCKSSSMRLIIKEEGF